MVALDSCSNTKTVKFVSHALTTATMAARSMLLKK